MTSSKELCYCAVDIFLSAHCMYQQALGCLNIVKTIFKIKLFTSRDYMTPLPGLENHTAVTDRMEALFLRP